MDKMTHEIHKNLNPTKITNHMVSAYMENNAHASFVLIMYRFCILSVSDASIKDFADHPIG